MGRMSWIFLSLMSVCVFSCGSAGGGAAEADDAAPAEVHTPVTVTGVFQAALQDSIQLNAQSSFLQRGYVKATSNGYLQSGFVQPGQYVQRGQVLYTLTTKEARSVGNIISTLDSSFHFSGVSKIRASQQGYVTELNHQVGDYVQDGEQLGVVSDVHSFAFLLSVPYEWRPYVVTGKAVDVLLPDGMRLKGVINRLLPMLDSAAQTLQVVIKVSYKKPLPENIIAKVWLLRTAKGLAQVVPKAAVLSDESQLNFWVMKLIDSVTAVKVPVERGMETKTQVEIVSPRFGAGDKLLLSGNYGLPDTAKVKIVQE